MLISKIRGQRVPKISRGYILAVGPTALEQVSYINLGTARSIMFS